jgi:TorA maturation chaperone TorD
MEAEEGGLAAAWEALRAAAAGARAAQVHEEYDSLFIGTGKAAVTLYTSAYTIRSASEVPLAALRAEFAALGVERRAGASEYEDHVAVLCETMRYLIVELKAGLPEQKRFFERWIRPTAPALCSAIDAADGAFFKTVARVLAELCMLEHRAFEML